ncbi:MAG: RnfABCDGE type electron transport complex subunit D [Planctomycetota bacterium]|jgi:electron transport complex protein RnfD|nr:RnfABCDGE type electron transport complex subunit D [Planctomycetota bacterium]
MSAEEKILFNINNSPHVRDGDSTPRIMFTVALALLPALAWSLFVFGWRALVPIVSATAACLLCESVCCWWRGRPNSLRDGSALVTGLLLAAVCPSNLPWWAAALGGVFAIGIGKQAFGGLGHNFWNPALLARAFMQVSMPNLMMSGEWPHIRMLKDTWSQNPFLDLGGGFAEISERVKSMADIVTSASGASSQINLVDVVTEATALARLSSATSPEAFKPTLMEIAQAWVGGEGGSLGEVSALMLLVGGYILLTRRIISWDIPFFFLATAAVLGFVLPHPYRLGDAYAYTDWFQGPWLLHLGSGGLMLGAFFMATDLVTSPITAKGRRIFAVGCGCMTILIRLFAGYPEGVCYAILFMNTCVPFIDSLTRPRVFGKRKPVKKTEPAKG